MRQPQTICTRKNIKVKAGPLFAHSKCPERKCQLNVTQATSQINIFDYDIASAQSYTGYVSRLLAQPTLETVFKDPVPKIQSYLLS